MKTTTNVQTARSAVKSNIIITLVGRACTLAILCLLTNTSFSQTTIKYGTALYSQLSANGYGGATLPMAYLQKGRTACFAGPVIQNRGSHISGVQVNYNYALTGPEISGDSANSPELYVFLSAAYNYTAFMGKRTLWEESMSNPEIDKNLVSECRFKSAEVFAGFGLRIKFLKRFKWDSSIGIGGYRSFNFPGNYTLYYNKQNMGLLLRTGLLFNFN